jgi:endonuclease YncB( thermonuclease family)
MAPVLPAMRRRRTRPSRPGRAADIALALLVLALLGLIVARLGPQGEVTRLTGLVRVVDGDTLVVMSALGDPVTVRLAGLDAPEARQTCERRGLADEAQTYPCGAVATDALAALAGQGRLDCEAARRDRYGRSVGTCRVGDVDIGAMMVRAGHAIATTDYYAEEDAARRAGAGLWAGSFDRPADWRAVHGDASGNVVVRLEEALERVWASVRGSRHAGTGGDQ